MAHSELIAIGIGPAVLSFDMTSAYVLYFPAAATATPPIFPNQTNYQMVTLQKLECQKLECQKLEFSTF